MATILREPTYFHAYRRAYLQDFAWSGVTPRGIPPQPGAHAPFTSRALPDNSPRRFVEPGFEAQSLMPPGTVTRPFIPPQFPEFHRRRMSEYFGVEAQAYLPVSSGAPFVPAQFPNITRRAYSDLGFESQAITPPGTVVITAPPFVPHQFPDVIRRAYSDLGFDQQAYLSISSAPAPFVPTEWPVPIRMRVHHQDFWWSGVTTRGIPVAVKAPFAQRDWPNPVRPRMAYTDSYASPHILLITPVLRPFAQTDWVNPARFRQTSVDWPWAGTTTRGIPPAPSTNGPFPAVTLEGYGIGLDALELYWSVSPGAAGYRIYIDGVPQPTVLHQRIVIVVGLAIDTQYTFNVVAVNAAGVDESPLSNTIYFERDSREIGEVYKYPWGDNPETGYVIKVPLDDDDDGE